MEFLKNTLKIILSDPEVLQFLALVISGMIMWVLKQTIQWFRLRISAERLARLTSAVDKVMTLGVTKFVNSTEDWRSDFTKNSIVTFGLGTLKDKFRDTLKANKLDLDKPTDRAAMIDMMERMWPEVTSRASASPATPPAPVLAAGVVPPPQP